MKVLNKINDLKDFVSTYKLNNKIIGLVPTMGYLHNGHKSLIEKARLENDKVIVSIFINPLQFSKSEDLSTYPKDIDKDLLICKNSNVDIVFIPDENEMYKKDFSSFVQVNNITSNLCGKSRPDHFKGVTTAVLKLFNITKCNTAYFGEKDYQQLKVIEKMVYDLNLDIKIVPCPIYREKDGLALSSRNAYLNQEERSAALCLNKSLFKAKQYLNTTKDSSKLKQLIIDEINKEPLAKIDYIEIVNATTLEPIKYISENTLIALAVFIGKTRLIDNLILKS